MCPVVRNRGCRLQEPLQKQPEIYFDDSFSALDFKTDAALRKALKEEPKKHNPDRCTAYRAHNSSC